MPESWEIRNDNLDGPLKVAVRVIWGGYWVKTVSEDREWKLWAKTTFPIY